MNTTDKKLTRDEIKARRAAMRETERQVYGTKPRDRRNWVERQLDDI